MNRSLASFAALVVLGAALGATRAAAAPASQGSLPPEIVGVEWALVSLRPANAAAEDTTGLGITLTLAADGTASGSGGCNRFFGGYTAGAGQSLTFDQIGGTLIACEDAIAKREQSYFATLESVTSYRLNSGSLVLQSGGSDVLVYTSGGAGQQLPTTGGAAQPALWIAVAGALILAAGALARRASRPGSSAA